MKITGYPIWVEVEQEMERLLKLPRSGAVDQNHARDYALLVASARDRVRWELKHQTENSCYLAYGYRFSLGRESYLHHREVTKRYRRSREAAQKIQATLTRTTAVLEKLTTILKQRQDDLPEGMLARHLCPNGEALMAICSSVQERLAIYLSEDTLVRDLKSAKKWNLTAAQLAFVWWSRYGPTGRGKWKERLTLANAWNLSDATSEDSLRRMVTRLMKTVTDPRLPPWIAP